jgi:hypothetical protein
MKATYFVRYVMALVLIGFTACSKLPGPSSGYDHAVVIIGDVRQGYGIYSQHVRNIINLQPAPDAAFCMGDIMLHPGNVVEWESFWHTGRPLTDKMPLYIVRGNHEGNTPEEEQIFSEQTGIPVGQFYYTVRIRNAAFIILDTDVEGEEETIGPEQFQWLEKELQVIQNDTMADHLFILLHRPVFAYGQYEGGGLWNADKIHQLLIPQTKLKAVFAGHDHIFHRQVRDGINYIITCGGGEPLYHGAGGDYYHYLLISFYNQNKRVNIKTIGIFNEVIEDFDI